MKTKFLLVILSVFVLTGCATMQRSRGTAPNDVLQTKVANLEEQVATRDQEIISLRNEVDRLSDRVDGQSSDDKVSYHRVEYVPLPEKASSGKTSAGDEEIIRVPVSAEQVQKALKAAGNYDGKIDGKIGEKTKSGIRDFQKANNLKADGIVGKSTWAALKSYVE